MATRNVVVGRLGSAGGATVEERDIPDPSLEGLKADKKAAATARRFRAETGGLSFGGATVATDRESQALITGAYNAAKNGVIATFDFKAASGWIQIDAATMIALGEALAAYIQACFTNEKAKHAAIDAAADAAAVAAVNLETGWP